MFDCLYMIPDLIGTLLGKIYSKPNLNDFESSKYDVWLNLLYSISALTVKFELSNGLYDNPKLYLAGLYNLFHLK